ncbi:dapper homolog 1 [Thalassophryne amazonica]|uniref:dapper homolog 1 n=1 Tax=Thalassophryne amazonica TaxID=390379 RepID=UPI001470C386|nr:dapper homolog 1 [Thalassophryne amazonica]
MHRAFSFPVPVERSRTKERLEASLAGLCELELRKQRQECLVQGALALGELRDSSRGELLCFSDWGQENLTLRRQLSALQSSPWGLMQALEQQVGELSIDTDDDCHVGVQGDIGDSRLISGFDESTEGQSPTTRSDDTTETLSSWTCTNDMPKSVGDPLMLNEEMDPPVLQATVPHSFSAPYTSLEGIAEESPIVEPWQWDLSRPSQAWPQQAFKDHVNEVDYHQALRVESYILSLIQNHTRLPQPSQPYASLMSDLSDCTSRENSGQLRTPPLISEKCPPGPHAQPQVDLLVNPINQSWGCDHPKGEDYREDAPSLEEDCYLALPYPPSRPHSLVGRIPSPLCRLEASYGVGVLDLSCEHTSPHHHQQLHPSICPQHNLVSAQYIPGKGCHAPVCSPRHYNPEQTNLDQNIISIDKPNSKSRTSKKSQNEKTKSKKSSNKNSRSHSENSLLGQQGLPERRYSTTERHHTRSDQAHNQGQVTVSQGSSSSNSGNRRWCSNLEIVQNEGDTHQSHRLPSLRSRHGQYFAHSRLQSYHHRPAHYWDSDLLERAPLCQGEEVQSGVCPAESESSMSELYSPDSSSLSSDSDESGGLVWPQQLPPRLASTPSSSPPQACAGTSSQPKTLVKIKASHALKKKILRFRSGSLKVMTTV